MRLNLDCNISQERIHTRFNKYIILTIACYIHILKAILFKTFEVVNVTGDPFFSEREIGIPFTGLTLAQCLCRFQEEFEDTKGVIRIRNSKKERQHNGQKKKEKQRSVKHTHKTKDRLTRIPLKTGGELRCSRRVSSSCSTSGTRSYKPRDKWWMRTESGFPMPYVVILCALDWVERWLFDLHNLVESLFKLSFHPIFNVILKW